MEFTTDDVARAFAYGMSSGFAIALVAFGAFVGWYRSREK